jgi:hypothetical protein
VAVDQPQETVSFSWSGFPVSFPNSQLRRRPLHAVTHRGELLSGSCGIVPNGSHQLDCQPPRAMRVQNLLPPVVRLRNEPFCVEELNEVFKRRSKPAATDRYVEILEAS